MKRYLILLLIPTLALSLLAGCGSKKDKTAQTNEPASSESTAASEEGTQEDSAAAEESGNAVDAVAEESAEDPNEIKDSKGLLNLMGHAEDYNVKGISYDYSYTVGDYSQTMKYAMKDDVIRTEMITSQEHVITIMSPDSFVNYSPENKTGTRMKMDTAVDETPGMSVSGDAKPEENIDTNTFAFKGKETVNGEPCYVFESKDINGGKMKGWVHQKYGIVMKWVIDGSDGKYTADVKNLKVGNVDDKLFEVPKDIQIQEVGAIPDMPMGE